MKHPRLLGALILTAAVASSGAAWAQPSPAERAEARQHFQSGVAAYGRRQWTTALEEFQSAYRLAPHPSVRVNMANCYVELHRPAEAIHHFEQFLSEAATAPPAQRAAVERQLATLRSQVGQVTVQVSPANAPGLAVTVDGQAISMASPATLAPGHYVIEGVAEGFQRARVEVDVAAGGTAPVALTLEPVAPPAPVVVATPTPPPTPTPPAEPATPTVVAAPTPPPAPTPEAPPRRGLRPGAFYVVAGVTGAAAIGWATFGALALSAQSDFDATAQQIQAGAGDYNALRARGADEADRARQFALISDVAMGLTLAGAVASVVLFLKTDFHPRVEVLASPTRGGGVLGLGGSF
ncbi:MAG: hypothetical protein R3A52_11810 [Polyangiales bacterium]